MINSLAHQQQNIPEVNEKEVTSALTQKTDARTDSASIAQIQEIRGGLYRAVQHDRRVDVYVQDFGRGIDSRYHKSIFERYFRAPGTKVQGRGLGLAISKDFFDAHGGPISIGSEIGKGCRFTVSLPV